MLNYKINLDRIFSNYLLVLDKERELRMSHYPLADWSDYRFDLAAEVYYAVWRIFEVARSSFVSRSYNTRYNLCKDDEVFESVGAHTNLASTILDQALGFYYESELCILEGKRVFDIEGYSHRDFIEAIRVHDLAENEMGDIPDNGNRDEEKKDRFEMSYFRHFLDTYPIGDNIMKRRVIKLLGEMQNQSSIAGRLVYLADKTAALFVTLCLDKIGKSPLMNLTSPYASVRDRREMAMCDVSVNGAYKASEMWAIDFFKERKIIRFDETMIFTKMIIMATLMVNKRWYLWRERDYV